MVTFVYGKMRMTKEEILKRIGELSGDVKGIYRDEMFKDLDQFAYEIAVQANDTYSGTLRVASEEIIHLALKLYPDAKME